MNKKRVDLLHDDIKKIYLKYLVPSVMSSIAVAMYVFVDTMFIGLGVGSRGLAALNIVLPVFTLFGAVSLIFGIGGATTLSICVGQGDIQKKEQVFATSIITAISLGIIISILGNLFSEQICLMLGSTKEMLPMVKEYFVILISFAWAFLASTVLGSFIRNDKNPKLVMTATIIANLTNVVLDYIFVFVFHWGMKGAVLATVISPVVNICIVSAHFFTNYNTLKLKFKYYTASLLGRILKNGFATFISEMARGLVLFIFNIILMRLGGEMYVSAYGIIINISFVGTCIFNGIAQSIQPIVSENFGANNIKRIFKSFNYALWTGTLLAIVCYCIFFIFPDYIVQMFIEYDEQLITIASQGMKLYFIGYAFCAFNIITLYFLQSVEKAKESIMISLSSGMIFSVLGLIILVPILGLKGVWLTVPFAEGVTLIISLLFIRMAKKNMNYKKEIEM